MDNNNNIINVLLTGRIFNTDRDIYNGDLAKRVREFVNPKRSSQID